MIAISTTKATNPKHYTWHHHEAVGVMQLVHEKTHPHGGGIKHYGGAFYYNVLNNVDKY